ncbi:MAG: manganese catalase family protein [Candidatus Cyclobacteriaceae bacterium M3_2C_046]
MFHHVKELQYNARVSKPDPRFASLLLEQFGGANGELKAAMQYFVQAFTVKQPYPKQYDLLMDIATEEFSHLEIVGATIQMLLNGVNGELKNVSEQSEIMKLLGGREAKENMIHTAMINPEFLVLSGGGPTLTNSSGTPWSGSYVTANGDPTVDLRSNIAAESRAKIVYEYLLQFTDDPDVKETLQFLMTREVAHFQQFEAALESIQPNFPPGVQQSDPRYSNVYFNMSDGESARGPWNQGKSTRFEEEWQYVEDPVQHVHESKGMEQHHHNGSRSMEQAREKTASVSKMRTEEIKKSVPDGKNQWSNYSK